VDTKIGQALIDKIKADPKTAIAAQDAYDILDVLRTTHALMDDSVFTACKRALTIIQPNGTELTIERYMTGVRFVANLKTNKRSE